MIEGGWELDWVSLYSGDRGRLTPRMQKPFAADGAGVNGVNDSIIANG
jgi:hypothetical protein